MAKVEWMGFEVEGPSHIIYPAFVAGVGLPILLVGAFVWSAAGPVAGVAAALVVAAGLFAFDRTVS